MEICLEDLETETERVLALRERLWGKLCAGLDGLRLNGHPDRRLVGNLNVSFSGIEADALLSALTDVALSTGSACASAKAEPSHVLAAIGLTPPLARSAVRFGIGRGNTLEEIDHVAGRVVQEVTALRRASGGH